MRKMYMKHIALAVGMAVIPAYAADLKLSENQPTIAGNAASISGGGKVSHADRSGKSVYIVQFMEPPLATYDGGISGLKATSNRSTGATKLNTRSKASKKYSQYLKKNQDKFVASMGAKKRVKFNYQNVFNGVALELSSAEAEAMATRPGVKNVFLECIEVPHTDVGPQWINADVIWNGPPNNVPHSQGEGIVIAVLDTGINHDSPSFAAVGGDGYSHTNPLGSGNYLPGSHCDTTDASFCNDKLIGAWSFVEEAVTPEDSDGHGSHTASTAGGNVVTDATTFAPTTNLMRAISGVAPHANIIAYDVCVDGCPGSALLAAINQVVDDAAELPDGIHALNYSISGGTDPYSDAVEIGFLNATAAGVFVSTSAGNSGPGAGTVAHLSPWVATTGANTHNRAIANSLVDMTSDGDSLANIVSVGFTTGYGPAAVTYAGDHPTANGSSNDTDPAQCLEPFPAGHFSGEIVVCDRGSIARTAKGENVLAGGAGGFVLANAAVNGESVSGDAHFLPAVHLGFTDGAILKDWVAANDNPQATISGYTLDIDDANGDVMAGFSSRGPNGALDILKPDVTAPGVDILAAVNTTDPSDPPEYGFISGTSMSSPHHAGAGAIVSAARPGWTPYAVKSAIMMTSNSANVLKEDGVTPADPFDMGAGSVNLARAIEADLVLNETPLNFWNANPAFGGDPRTLNIASMQDGACLGECSWTRTFTNTSKHTIHVDLMASGSGGASFSVEPSSLKIKKGKTGSFTVHADTLTAEDWNFGRIDVGRRGDGPDLHLPIAVNAVTSTDPTLFNKTVDKSSASDGDVLTYEIVITNGQLAGEIDLTDVIPPEVTAVPGSETEAITDGFTISVFTIDGGTATWSGILDQGSMLISDATGTSPGGGFVPLEFFGIAPIGCPGSCDEGGQIFDVPSFSYNGTSYNQTIMSVNGTLEMGSASGTATSFVIEKLPSANSPNNLLAPFWSDLDLTDGGSMSVGILAGGGFEWTIYEWSGVPLWGTDGGFTYSFQVWIQNDNTENIWFVYGDLGPVVYASIGAENANGSTGHSYLFTDDGSGTAPVPGDELAVSAVAGGTATFTFQAEVDGCSNGSVITNQAEISTADANEKAIAVTICD